MATCSGFFRSVTPLPFTTHVAREDDPTILEVNQISKHFGGLKAVDEVELSVRRNTVHALVGPNGSGKTTLLNVLSGIYKPTNGRLFLTARLSPAFYLMRERDAGSAAPSKTCGFLTG
jgi:ABC-type sugar transport system ATPase subunit